MRSGNPEIQTTTTTQSFLYRQLLFNCSSRNQKVFRETMHSREQRLKAQLSCPLQASIVTKPRVAILIGPTISSPGSRTQKATTTKLLERYSNVLQGYYGRSSDPNLPMLSAKAWGDSAIKPLNRIQLNE